MDDGTRDLLRGVANVYGLLFGLAGLAGVGVLLWRRDPSSFFVVLTGLGMLVPPLIFFGDPRFHVPAVPIAAIAAGALVAAVRYRSTSFST